MRRFIGILLIIMLLAGCGNGETCMEQALRLRSKLSAGCSYDARITADFGDKTYSFSLHCVCDGAGNLQFTVLVPESISGICGTVEAGAGKLTFSDVALSFELLADGQLSPVSGPWVMIKALLEGYITSAGMDGEYTRVSLRDTYEEKAMTVDVWLGQESVPVQADILWENRRILTISVENFAIG